MVWLLFLFLTGCAVKCDDSNYYVIEMPVEHPPITEKQNKLQVYWNVPTMQCKSKKIPFRNLERFGIIQNRNDSFRGEKISILYDPGFFPALLRNESSGQLRFRNGGVPQEGNLELHLKSFRSVLDQSIPDENFSGIAIIDFESWRPIFRQNFGEVHPYKAVSYEIERNKHWFWPKAWIHDEAKSRFEEAARVFMQNTISVAKQMRPKARWGYYGFPYCFNMAAKNMKENCATNVNSENNQIDWLWMESTALYPSVYSPKDLSTSQLAQLIRGRITEAARVRRQDTPIFPYFWFRYRDGGFLSETDLHTAFQTFRQSQASGFIIWGSSNDVNTVDKCQKLLNYMETVFGPILAKYTKSTYLLENKTTTDSNAINVEDVDNKKGEVKNTTDSSEDIDSESFIDEENDDYNGSTKPILYDSTDTSTNTALLEETDPTSTVHSLGSESESVTKLSNNKTIFSVHSVNLNSFMDILLNKIFGNEENVTDNVHTTLVKDNDEYFGSTENTLENNQTDDTSTKVYKLPVLMHKITNLDNKRNDGLVKRSSTESVQIMSEYVTQESTNVETSTYKGTDLIIDYLTKNYIKSQINPVTEITVSESINNISSTSDPYLLEETHSTEFETTSTNIELNNLRKYSNKSSPNYTTTDENNKLSFASNHPITYQRTELPFVIESTIEVKGELEEKKYLTSTENTLVDLTEHTLTDMATDDSDNFIVDTNTLLIKPNKYVTKDILEQRTVVDEPHSTLNDWPSEVTQGIIFIKETSSEEIFREVTKNGKPSSTPEFITESYNKATIEQNNIFFDLSTLFSMEFVDSHNISDNQEVESTTAKNTTEFIQGDRLPENILASEDITISTTVTTEDYTNSNKDTEMTESLSESTSVSTTAKDKVQNVDSNKDFSTNEVSTEATLAPASLTLETTEQVVVQIV